MKTNRLLFCCCFLLISFTVDAQLTKGQWWVDGRFKLEDDRWRNSGFIGQYQTELDLQYHVDRGFCLAATAQYFRNPNRLLINRGLGFRIYSRGAEPMYFTLGFQYFRNIHHNYRVARTERFPAYLISGGVEVFKEKDVGFRIEYFYQFSGLQSSDYFFDRRNNAFVKFKLCIFMGFFKWTYTLQ